MVSLSVGKRRKSAENIVLLSVHEKKQPCHRNYQTSFIATFVFSNGDILANWDWTGDHYQAKLPLWFIGCVNTKYFFSQIIYIYFFTHSITC